MYSIRKVCTRMLSLVLVLMLTVSVFPMQSTAASYSGMSSGFANGKYGQAYSALALTGNQRVDIVNVAKTQVGYQEGNSGQYSGEVRGSSNVTEYGRWYGMQDMWCAMFVSWCAMAAGIPSSIITYHAYTPTGLNWFRNKGQAYTRATVAAGGYTPIAGDIIYFKSPRNTNITNHIGIVTGYSGGTVYTVEGNTSSATVSTNGGAVASKSYAISNTYIVYICKPAYTTGDSLVTTSYATCIDTSDTGANSKLNGSVTNYKTVSRDDGTFNLKGWGVHSNGVDHFEYKVNDGIWNYLNGMYRDDVAAAMPDYDKCTTTNAYSMDISLSSFNAGSNAVEVRGVSPAGDVFTVGVLTLFVKPSADESTLSVPLAESGIGCPTNGQLMVTAQGASTTSWVGLYAEGDVVGNVSAYYTYTVGDSQSNFDLIGKGTNTGRGELAPGNYKVVLFVDSSTVEDKSVVIELTSATLGSLDEPTAEENRTWYGNEGALAPIKGWSLHDSGISKFTVTIDNSAEIELAMVERSDVITAYPEYEASCGLNVGFEDTIDTTGFSVGTHTATVFAYPNTGDKYAVGSFSIVTRDKDATLTVDVTETEAGSPIYVTAASKNPNAWVGLYLSTDVTYETTPFYSYKLSEVGSGDGSAVAVNIIAQTASTTRTLSAGTYKIVLFKDTDSYSADTNNIVEVVLVAPTEFHGCLDFPTAAQSIYRGTSMLIRGWGISTIGITQYEAIIDGGEPIVLTPCQRDDVLAVYPAFAEACKDLNGFNMEVSTASLEAGVHNVAVRALLPNGYYKSVGSAEVYIQATPEEMQITTKTDSTAVIKREENKDAIITGIGYDSTVDDIKNLLNETDCTVYDANGTENPTVVGTGSTIVRYDTDGTTVVDTVTVIVSGDLDGDGMITSKDILLSKLHLTAELETKYTEAVDMSGDGNVNTNDLQHMSSTIASLDMSAN